MAVQLRAFLAKAAGNSATQTFTKPSSPGAVVAGDLMQLHLTVNTLTAPTSTPSGWTLVESSVSTTPYQYIYTKTATGSEPASYDFTWAGSVLGSGGILALSSDASHALVVHATDKQSTSSSSTCNWPTVTTTIANTFLCYFAYTGGSATPDNVACTERWDNVSQRSYLMTEPVAAIGTTTARTATISITTDSRSITIAVAESIGTATAADSVSVSESVTVTRVSATSRDVSVSEAVTVATAPSLFVTAAGFSVSESVSVSATPTLAIAPSKPTALSATAITTSRIDLTWSHDGLHTDGYSIERSTNALTGFVEIDTTVSLSYSDTGLTSNTTYYYKVRAYNT